MLKHLTKHWKKIYKKTNEDKLGWYESDYAQTMKFVNQIPLKNIPIQIPPVIPAPIYMLFIKD